jgi:cell division protease FtsH
LNSTLKSLLFWMVLVVVGVLIWQFSAGFQRGPMPIAFTTFLSDIEKNQVVAVTITGNEITGERASEAGNGREQFRTYVPGTHYQGLANRLAEKGIAITAKPETTSPWATLLYSWAPLLLMIGFWIFIMRQMQSGGNKALSFGKSRAKLSSSSQKKVTFKDVSGVDEAKEELQEIIEFLKEPQKFQKLGGRIPKGVLLMGPPGTGKTLLARAVAGEANVPFFSISGSDFVEMFVGVGASRVRDLFEQGKKNAPCIVFIDEIDAVGRHRGAGLGGGHDEREQTLNQLLVEMDGFESNEGVILVAATNRPDVLDPALLRPGRFDRRIVVNRPDVKGREGILAVHTKKIPLADDVNIHVLARGTSGFSGADLANLVNEAALNAARYNQKVVRMLDFEFAKDKVLMGSERRSMIINEEEKKVTAVHEAGHALLAVVLPHADPVHKVTIIPRGMALGVTMQLPVDDKHNYTRDYLNDQIAILLGGRIAEEITMKGITTGAGNDLERSTELARKMVCEWGMSDAMGPLTFGKKEEQIFLGREIAQHQDYSEDTAIRIDQEIKRFVTANYERARTLLEKHRHALDRIAEELLVREVLDAEQVRRIVAGEKLEEHRPPAAAASAAPDDGSRRQAKERPSIVSPLPPLNKPVPQE